MALPKLGGELKDAQKIDSAEAMGGKKVALDTLDVESDKEAVVDIDQPVTYGDLSKSRTNSLPPLPTQEKPVVESEQDHVNESEINERKETEKVENDEEKIEEEELSKEEQQKDREEFEEKVVEKVVYKDKKSRKLLPGCSCRSCSCFGCLAIIFLIVFFGLVLYFRPPFVWNVIKDTLNAGYNPPVVEQRSQIETRERIQSLVETNPVVEVTEAELQSLLNDKIKSTNYRIDIEPNYLRLARDIDSNPKQPLWIILEFGQGSSDNVKVTKLGFERVNVPGFMRDAVSDSIVNALRLSGDKTQDDTITIINFALDLDADSVAKVRFDKDKITITTK